MITPTKQDYIAARKLLSDPSKFGRGHYYTLDDGTPTDKEHTVRFCIYGALRMLIGSEDFDPKPLQDVSWNLTGRTPSGVNDGLGQEAVLILLDEIIDGL